MQRFPKWKQLGLRMKTENLDFLAAVRLLKENGGYIYRPCFRDEWYIALDCAYGSIECCCYIYESGRLSDFYLLRPEHVLENDWVHVNDD